MADMENEGKKRAASASPEKRAAVSKAVGTMLDAFFAAASGKNKGVLEGPVLFAFVADGAGGFRAEVSDSVSAQLIATKVSRNLWSDMLTLCLRWGLSCHFEWRSLTGFILRTRGGLIVALDGQEPLLTSFVWLMVMSKKFVGSIEKR